MIHNIVTDRDGDEHQAVLDDKAGDPCARCSLDKVGCIDIGAECISLKRDDHTDAIYKRRIKIGDIKR